MTVENNYQYPRQYVKITLHHQQRDKSHNTVHSIAPSHLQIWEIFMRNNNGPKMLPLGKPLVTLSHAE